jgi:hypothetical protein
MCSTKLEIETRRKLELLRLRISQTAVKERKRSVELVCK